METFKIELNYHLNDGIKDIDKKIDAGRDLLLQKFMEVLTKGNPAALEILEVYKELLELPVLIDKEENLTRVAINKLELIDQLLQIIDSNLAKLPGLRALLHRKMIDDFESIAKAKFNHREATASYLRDELERVQKMLLGYLPRIKFIAEYQKNHDKLMEVQREEKRMKIRFGIFFTILRENFSLNFDIEAKELYDKFCSRFRRSDKESNWSRYVEARLSACLTKKDRFTDPGLFDAYRALKTAVEEIEKNYRNEDGRSFEKHYEEYLERKGNN